MMIAISFSRWGTEVPNRTKAPRRWTRSQSSGLRKSALKGPGRPAPRGPDWIASATRFWSAVIVSGVSVANLPSLMDPSLMVSAPAGCREDVLAASGRESSTNRARLGRDPAPGDDRTARDASGTSRDAVRVILIRHDPG